MSKQRSRTMWTNGRHLRENRSIVIHEYMRPGYEAPIRVTDISDEPPFRVGDRVQHAAGSVGTVLSPPFHDDMFERWYVAVRASAGVFVWPCPNLTKLPRTKSVTLRVTGPEEQVKSYLDSRALWPGETALSSVRVERVEDDE